MRLVFAVAVFVCALVNCSQKEDRTSEATASPAVQTGAPQSGSLQSRQLGVSSLSSSDVQTSQMKEVQRILSQFNAVQTPQGVMLSVPADVLFDFDKHEIRGDAQTALSEVAKVLSHYGTAPVQIYGHTDSVGDDDYNQKLSERRAESVKIYLNSRMGIDGGRITTQGFGETKPVAQNLAAGGADDPQGRQKNRRVEVVIRGSAMP